MGSVLSVSVSTANRPAARAFATRSRTSCVADSSVYVASTRFVRTRLFHRAPRGDHAGEVADERVELQVEEQVLEPRAVRLAAAQRLEIEIDRQVLADGYQPLGKERVGGKRLQRLAGALALDLRRVGQQVLDGPVLLDQLDRRLGADPLYPRHVVAAVADQAQVVDDVLRRHAQPLVGVAQVHPLLLHRRGPAAAGVQQADVGADELVEVLVAADDDSLQPLVHRLRRQRADHVVGLVALQLQDGDVERLHQLADAGKGERQLVGHLFARGLVLGVHLHPLAVARVEHHSQVVGMVLLEDLDQEPRDPPRGRGVLAPRADQRPRDHREEGAVDERVAVDQVQAVAGLFGLLYGHAEPADVRSCRCGAARANVRHGARCRNAAAGAGPQDLRSHRAGLAA